ncbi:NAD-dependent epimerase/dehydratase family protein [Streptomyces sp. NA02950]|uniref:NAD-dependent epimerase/dehydratase family protein n=1 Tax=Streptomyces sp. NA02950 TaxID=2742137 RepID=UPI001590CFA7|nr:NAD-dependent epimerase/dehydratase family protein [Streptomyces sp. NA02950]QKV90670.1 NAD-dependent epimerase/dehydratase family protein [Streptomyces sp. NA02950]
MTTPDGHTNAHVQRDPDAPGLRVVVVGATGNVGSAVVRTLGEEAAVSSMLGLARRVPDWTPEKTAWRTVDLGDPDVDLVPHFRGADVVVHLAWLFQPTHEPVTTWRGNVLGGVRVFEATAAAGVPALVYASSVGAYSPGPQDRAVDESWPTHGWPEAAYTREKAYLERFLDAFEARHPDLRVVRMRLGFLFQRQSASQQRRLFGGPLVPGRLVRPGLVPVVPDVPGLRFQVLHTEDAAAAYRAAVTRDVRGAFNLAAEPPVDAGVLAEILGARVLRVPRTLLRGGVAGAWKLRLAPASPELFDAVLRIPLMDTSRARRELGWEPRHTVTEALEEFLRGLREGAGGPTPPLAEDSAGGRVHEVATGVGKRP